MFNNVDPENYKTIRQTVQLPSSGWVCNGWEFYIEQTVGGELDLFVLIGGSSFKVATSVFAEGKYLMIKGITYM